MPSQLELAAKTLRMVEDRTFWPAMIDYLHGCLPFDNVIVIVFRGEARPEVIYRRISGPDVFCHLDELYLPASFLLDPIYHYHLGSGKAGIYRLLDIAPDQFFRSHYYEWYYGRIGITDEVSVILPLGKDTTLTISMGKDNGSGTMFGPQGLDDIRQHEPLIFALLDLHFAQRAQDSLARPSAPPTTQPLIASLEQAHAIRITQRQAEVALLILQGHSSNSIALRLDISPRTVKVFRRQLYERCGVTSQAELFAMLFPVLSAI